MATSKRIHVVPKENRWAVKREGNIKASAITNTKAEAYDVARMYAKSCNGEVITHNKNGRISNPNSFGNDPCPPKDKKH